MLSKFLRTAFAFRTVFRLVPVVSFNRPLNRVFGGMIPKTQYDIPLSKKLKLRHVLKTNWELWPIFLVCVSAMIMIIFAVIWSVQHKVDVVFSTHNRNNISRTMDLCEPTVHKLCVFAVNQYEPWPEMAQVLHKMKKADQSQENSETETM